MKRLIIAGSAVFLFAACERKTETAQVRIKFADSAGQSKVQNSVVSAQAVSGGGDSGGNFGVPTPSSINDFDCFAIFVGGPESDLRDLSCAKGEGASFEKIFFHYMKGFVTINSEIKFEVKPGPARKFYVLGAKSANGVCQAFAPGNDINSSLMSNPLLLGTTEANLNPGDNNISISAKLDADTNTQTVRTCSFLNDSSGPPEKLSFNGAVSTYDGGSDSKLGLTTCNVVRVFAERNNGSALLDSDLQINLAATNVTLKSDPSCANTLAGPVTISPGKNYAEFYVSAPTNGPGTLTASGLYNGVSLTAARNIDVANQGPLSELRYFEDRLSLAAGGCAEVTAWAVDANQRSVVIPGATTFQVFSLDGVFQSVPTGLDFKSSCAGSVLSPAYYPSGSAKAFAKFAISMGSIQHKDFQVGHATTPALSINLVPRALGLNLSLENQNPYVSDCTAATLSTNGVIAPGRDDSPISFTGNPDKRVVADFNPQDGLALKSTDNQCSSGDPYSNHILTNASNSVTRYFKFSNPGPNPVRAWAGGFVSGNNEATAQFNAQWDPGMWLSMPSGTFGMFHSPLSLTGTSYSTGWPAKVLNYPSGTTAASGPVEVASAIGSLPAIGFTSNSQLIRFQGLSTTVMTSNFSFGLLVKPTSSFLAGGTLALAFSDGANDVSIIADATDSIKIKGLNSGTASVSTSSHSVSTSNWVSLVVVRQATSCKLFVNGIDGGANDTAVCGNPFLSNVQVGGFGAGSPTGFQVREFFMLARPLGPTEISDYYNNYLKLRYTPFLP